MNAVLATREFWRPYLMVEPVTTSAEEFAAQLDGLRDDYSVQEHAVYFERGGTRCKVIQRTVEFRFTCGSSFELSVSYEPGGEKGLYLTDKRTGARHQMGWWDLAGWHPFCLRSDELRDLIQFWQQWDHRWPRGDVPLLLLAQFVGVADTEDLEQLQVAAEGAYRSLGLPPLAEGQPNVTLYIPDGCFRWELDEHLGWVFTSDEYGCYSLRNRAHADSKEGRFPFGPFQEMMADVRARLNRGGSR